MKRRTFLKSIMALTGVVFIGSLGFLVKKILVPIKPGEVATLLKRYFDSDDIIFKLGAAYAKAQPQLTPQDCLKNILEPEELPTVYQQKSNSGGTQKRLFEAVKKAREEDLTRGDLVTVNNWFLTPTEANLYALFYLSLSPKTQ